MILNNYFIAGPSLKGKGRNIILNDILRIIRVQLNYRMRRSNWVSIWIEKNNNKQAALINYAADSPQKDNN